MIHASARGGGSTARGGTSRKPLPQSQTPTREDSSASEFRLRDKLKARAEREARLQAEIAAEEAKRQDEEKEAMLMMQAVKPTGKTSSSSCSELLALWASGCT